jgi:hypothetical protein
MKQEKLVGMPMYCGAAILAAFLYLLEKAGWKPAPQLRSLILLIDTLKEYATE